MNRMPSTESRLRTSNVCSGRCTRGSRPVRSSHVRRTARPNRRAPRGGPRSSLVGTGTATSSVTLTSPAARIADSTATTGDQVQEHDHRMRDLVAHLLDAVEHPVLERPLPAGARFADLRCCRVARPVSFDTVSSSAIGGTRRRGARPHRSRLDTRTAWSVCRARPCRRCRGGRTDSRRRMPRGMRRR